MLTETRKIQKTPLFKQIECKFQEDEQSEMEKRKRHLQSIRELKLAPIDHEEMVEHGKKVEEMAREKAEQRKQHRMAQVANSYDYSKY